MSQLSAAPDRSTKQILRWAYLRRELVFISWALMEVALIVPLSLAILPWTDEWWGRQRLFVGVFLLMLAGFYLARFLSWLRLPGRDQRNILVGVGAIFLFLAIRNLNYQPESLFDLSWIGQSLRNLAIAESNLWLRDLFLLMITAISWWRGLTLLNRDIDVVRVGQRFRVGGLYVMPLVVLLAWLRLDWSILPFILFFFVIGLTAVALTRAESLEKEQKAILASLSPRWFGLVVLFSLLTAFLGGGTAVFISGASTDAMGRGLEPLWNALRWAGSAIGLTLSYLFTPFLSSLEAVLQFVIRVFQEGFARLFVPNPNAQEATDPAGDLMAAFNEWMLTQQGGEAGLFSSINFRLVIIGLVLLLALVILAQFYRKNLVALGNGRFGQALLDITNRISPTRRTRNKNQQKQQRWGNWRTAVSIIKIYQHLTDLARNLGHPRGHSETPYEYLQTLTAVWPNHQKDVQLITRAYVKVRYGEFPESREEFEAIKQAWERVRETAEFPTKHS